MKSSDKNFNPIVKFLFDLGSISSPRLQVEGEY